MLTTCTRVVLVAMAALLSLNSNSSARALGDLSGPWILFADNHAVASKENVSRTYHAFEKHTENPILPADKAWEGSTVYLYGTVLPAESGNGYRMWYHAWADGEYRMLYATSTDGIHWNKPPLGLVEYQGSTENNILFHRTHENHNPQIIHTPWEKDPARHYKLIYYEYGRTPPNFTTSGYLGMTSPDGIHWTDVTPTPVLLADPGDVGNFVWDPHAEQYLGWPKHFSEVRGFRRRCVGVSATKTFEEWPASELILTPDEYDDRWVNQDSAKDAHTDFYGLTGFAYESMYIGFLWVFPITNGKNDGPIFAELVTSHDGVRWERQEKPRPPILPLGPDGAWDDGMVFTPNHPLVEGDTIKLYYGGFNVTHGVSGGTAAIGLATLRKDGFASLHAGPETGTVTTKLLTGTSGALRLNFRAPVGSVRVELVDGLGVVLPGYDRDSCTVLSGDAVEGKVMWGDTIELPKDSRPLRIRFLLQNAELFSFHAGEGVRVAGV